MSFCGEESTMNLKQSIRAFTLIELLVTIGIIAILAAILLPAIKAALLKAEKARCQTEVNGLASAIKAYYNEYSKFPNQTTPKDASYGGVPPKNNNYLIISVLVSNNARKISFLEIADSSRDAAGNYLDPWDMQYGITVDGDFDNSCSQMEGGGVSSVGGRTVAVWSAGPNQVTDVVPGDKADDDILSWK